MTLFRQNLLFLIPLFLVLGILYAYISFMLQTKELKWSVDQEAKAIGHTIQSFVEHRPDKYLETSDISLSVHQELETVLNRIIKQNKNESISVISATGDTLIHILTTESNHELFDWIDPEILYNSSFEETMFRLERKDDLGRLVVNTDLIVSDITLSLVIIRNGQDYLLRIRELRRWIAIEILISLVLGTIVSILLTVFIKHRINTLTQLSANFLQGNSALELDKGAISEFNDLGSTLNILVNVYHKNLDWYRKSIQRNEQLRTSQNLADYFLSQNDRQIKLSNNRLTVTADVTGQQAYSMFLGVTRSENSQTVVWGIVDETEPIEAALLSDSISKHISKNIDVSDVISNCLALFGKKITSINQLVLGEKGEVRLTYDLQNQSDQEQIIDTSNMIDFWIHGLGEDVTEKINMYCQHALKNDSEHLFDEVRELVGLFGSTVLIQLKKDE